MKDIFRLTGVELGSVLEFINIFGKKVKKNTKISIIFLISIVFLMSISGIYSYFYGVMLAEAGHAELLIGIMMSAVSVLILFTSVYKVKGTIFGFKSYDMFMSFPVETWKIVSSRLLLLYLVNIIFTVIIMLPCTVVYGILVKPSVVFYILSLAGMFFIPLVPITIASAAGTILFYASSKFKHSNILSIVFFIFIFGAVMIFSFSISSNEELITANEMLVNNMKSTYPLAKLYIEAITEYNLKSYIYFIIISFLSFALFSALVGMLFKKINTSINTFKKSDNYKISHIKKKSAYMAVYYKDLKRLLTSPAYLMNTCITIIMMIIAALVTFFMKPEEIMQLLKIAAQEDTVKWAVPFLLSIMAAMAYITACSISLEGNNLWLLKSIPISANDIFNAKAKVNLSVTIPFILLCSVIFKFTLDMNIYQFLSSIIMPASVSFMFSYLGIAINLKFPKFDWTNEVAVIKQGLSSMLYLIAVGAAIFIFIAVYVLINNIELMIILITAFSVISGMLLKIYLYKNGERIFKNL